MTTLVTGATGKTGAAVVAALAAAGEPVRALVRRPADVVGATEVVLGDLHDVAPHLDDVSAQINGSAPQAFGSRHPGGAFFGFGDGSVRFFRQNAVPSEIKWLGNRYDGKVISYDF